MRIQGNGIKTYLSELMSGCQTHVQFLRDLNSEELSVCWSLTAAPAAETRTHATDSSFIRKFTARGSRSHRHLQVHTHPIRGSEETR